MTHKNLTPALSIAALVAVASSGFAQTSFSIPSANFNANPGNLDNTGLPSGDGIAFNTTGTQVHGGASYQLGASVSVTAATVTPVATGTFENEPSVRLENSAFPGLFTYFSLSAVNATYTGFAISSPTVRPLGNAGPYTWNPVRTLLDNVTIPSGSTWAYECYESFDDSITGVDATGTGIAFATTAYVPPPAATRTPWVNVTGNTLPIIYDNGTIVNAAGLGAGGADASTIGTGGTTFGSTSSAPLNFKLADDFVVPAGGWTVTAVSAFAYQTGSTIAVSPFASANIEIWNGDPSQPTSAVIATGTGVGDIVWTNAYRVTAVSPFTGATRPVYRVQSTFPSLSLAAGTYWVTYQLNTINLGTCFTPYVTGSTTQPAAILPGNAIQQNGVGGPWAALADATIPTDIPFLIHGTAAATNVNLTGTLNLNDTSGTFAFNRAISYAVKQGTTTVASGTVTADASSESFSISVPSSATGAATIEWDGSSFLMRKTNINLTGSAVAVGSVSVQNGDVDNSGEVDAVDIDEVIADFGDTSDNSSDVDVSGEVDAADIDIVIANFGGVND